MDLPLEPLLNQRVILLVVRTRTPVPPLAHPTLSCRASAKVALTLIPLVLGEALVLTPVLPPWADLRASLNKDLSETRWVPRPREDIYVTILPVV